MSERDDERTVPRTSAPMPVRALQCVLEGGAAAEAEERLTVGSAEGNDLVVADRAVSRFHLELRRADGGIVVRDLGSTNGTRIGAVSFRATEVVVTPGTVVEIGGSRVRAGEASRYVARASGPTRLGGIEGSSAAIRAATSTLLKVAPSEVSVLVTGESGTGKELAARAIHEHSPRAAQPFVTLDCGAIAPSLFASELFGHERGAFTGAERRRAGAFEIADGGTLLLDEVGELGPELQAALLGALQRKRFRRVGGTTDVPVDVRIVAATHRDLRAMVNTGAFRLDLYFRLATVRIEMPPLRERLEDIPLLVERILVEAGHEGAHVFSEEAMQALAAHAWPGNVRELRNVVLGALALGGPPVIEELVRANESDDVIARVLDAPYASAKRAVLDAFERRWLTRVLERVNGNVRAAAREGSIERKHLIELLRRHGLTPDAK